MTKPRRRAKNAPTKRAPELSKEEKAAFHPERTFLRLAGEVRLETPAEKDTYSDVNIATIFSLFGKEM